MFHFILGDSFEKALIFSIILEVKMILSIEAGYVYIHVLIFVDSLYLTAMYYHRIDLKIGTNIFLLKHM